VLPGAARRDAAGGICETSRIEEGQRESLLAEPKEFDTMSGSENRPNDRSTLRRCFISAQAGAATKALAEAFASRGIECFRPDDIAPRSELTPELLHHLEAADFVGALLNDAGAAPNVMFELGAAYNLRKPIILFTTTYDRLLSGLRGIYVVRATIDEIASVSADIDRFLHHAGAGALVDQEGNQQKQRPSLSWTRDELADLRSTPGGDRGRRFERLVGEVFRRSGGEVVQAPSDEGADLIVWLDDVAYEVGGPMIVQCKYYGGGSGSIRANAKHTADRLEAYLDASDAKVAFIVYDHDRRTTPPPMETPRVLVFSIDELIKVLEGGAFAEEVLRRRRRASSAMVLADGVR
jgi:hypothetical protein